jgi:hypothetical protein
MLHRHRGLGSDDYAFRNTHDTFCVRGQELESADFGNFIAGYGAGYALDPVALAADRLAGSIYGAGGTLLGYNDASFDQFLYAGDNTRSVLFIQGGAATGLYDRIHL